MDWILNNWAEIALALLAFADVLVSLNPKWGGEKLGYLQIGRASCRERV